MKRDFMNERFEDFLRQSTDGLRMRPSDKVWQGISQNLNRRRRRGGWAIGSFLLALFTFGYFLVDNASRKFEHLAEAGSGTPLPNAPAAGTDRNSGSGALSLQPLPPSPQKENISSGPSPLRIAYRQPQPQVVPSGASEQAGTSNLEEEESTAPNAFVQQPVDSYEPDAAASLPLTAAVEKRTSPALPQTIESVVNSYKKPRAKKSLSYQFYFTPTVSYRRLTENKAYLRSDAVNNNPAYVSAAFQDVNNEVYHKPNIGLEFGLAARYPVSSRLNLRAGLQFNLNRYDIRAYTASTAVATIMLNGRSNVTDSVSTASNYSNQTGYSQSWIQNLYFQLSAPIGVEYKLNRSKKVTFGVATTIQPTYVLSDRAYLISTDYKSYAEMPDMVRRWNVNTSLETFVGYSTGRLSWQVGPQVRYQLLSSFVTKYPVKENLFDFGLRVGVSINNRND